MSTLEAWKKDNLVLFKFTASKNTPIPDAIKKAAEDNKISPSNYVKNAVIEKLQFEGYLPQDYSGPKGKLIK